MHTTPEEARKAILQTGVPITQWAMSRGFSPNLVFSVLSGKRKSLRGQSHRIAVALGLKGSDMTNSKELT